MNTHIGLTRRLALAAALSLIGSHWVSADAAVVRGATTDAIEHSYGRAGGLAGSDEVSGAKANDGTDPTVTITYSPDVAQWTNMPRNQAHEGPVTDGLGTASAPQPDVLEHWYGRAGGPVGAETMETQKAPASNVGSRMDTK